MTRLKESYIIFKLREGRGSGYINQIWDYVRKGTDISFMLWILFDVRIKPNQLAVVALVYLTISYLIGNYDHTRGRVMHDEAEVTLMITPYYAR